MRDVSVEIKVGTVVIIAIVILIYSIIWVKEYKFNVEHYEYTCLFPEIGSLDIGDPVRVLGVQKGEVKDIAISGNNVAVKFSLESDVQLMEDARFLVMNVGLMGERFIAVWPGESKIPRNLNVPGYGRYDTGIPEVMGMMGLAIDELRRLIFDIEGIFGKPGKGQQLKDIIDRLDRVSSRIEELAASNQDNLDSAIKNFSHSAAKLRNFIDSNSTSMQATMDNLSQASLRASSTLAQLDTISGKLHEIVASLNDGKGTLGKTLADDSLYYDLRRTLSNLDSLVTDFKTHPKKYISISIF